MRYMGTLNPETRSPAIRPRPEQARGAPDIDARADVFALGCILYECLGGRPAFAGEHVMAVLARILLGQGKERADEARKLLDWGYRAFERVTLFQANEVIAELASVMATSHGLGDGRRITG